MTQTTIRDLMVSNLTAMLHETFVGVHGIYLDRGTSLLETLATVSAEQASQQISSASSTLAAKVIHLRFYIHVLERYMFHQQEGKVDWDESWKTQTVTAEEWATLLSDVKADYDHLIDVVKNVEDWNDDDLLGGAWAIVVHTAHHLGEIREALGVFADRQ